MRGVVLDVSFVVELVFGVQSLKFSIGNRVLNID